MVRHFTTQVIVCKNIKWDGGSTSLSFYNQERGKVGRGREYKFE